MPAHPSIEDNRPRALLSQKAFDFRDRDARLPPNGNRADFADLLTQRRTVNGCKPRRLATSPERSRRVFSVLITRIDYQIYVNLSTVIYPFLWASTRQQDCTQNKSTKQLDGRPCRGSQVDR